MNFNVNVIFAKLLSLSLLATFVLVSLHNTLAQTAQQVARETLPSVVLVVGQKGKQKSITIGSGFWISSNRVVTNHHVIRGIKNLFIKQVGKKQLIKVKKVVIADSQKDLAVLEVEGNIGRELKLSETSVAIGEDIYVIGNPEGLEGTLSQGIISQLRKIDGKQFLQITAPVSPGSSGGPVLNKNGEVVGVVVGSMSKGQNLNFAISVTELKKVIVVEDIFLRDIDNQLLEKPILTQDKISNWIEPDRSPKVLDEINQAKKKRDSDPNDLNSILDLAETYKKNHWFDEAIQLLQEELKKRLESAEINYELGEVYQSIYFSISLFQFERIANILGENNRQTLEKIYWQKAKSYYVQAIRIKPNYYPYHLELCSFLAVSFHINDEAITACTIASQMKDDPETFYYLAISYESIKKTSEAIKAYKTVLTLDPKHRLALSALGRIYQQQRDYKEALFYYQKNISIGIEELSIAFDYEFGKIGECFVKSNSALGGISYFKYLLEELRGKNFKNLDYPPNVAVHYALGRLYLEIGDKKSALEQYQIIKSLGEGKHPFRAEDLFKRIYPQ